MMYKNEENQEKDKIKSWIKEAIYELGLKAGETEQVLFTKKDLSAKFNVTIQTINEWMRKGILPFVKINSRVFFKAEDIDKLLTDKTFRNGK